MIINHCVKCHIKIGAYLIYCPSCESNRQPPKKEMTTQQVEDFFDGFDKP